MGYTEHCQDWPEAGHSGHADRERSSEVTAIASRSKEKAEVAASSLGIDKAYGSYEALLEDPDVDVIYNPLPNNLHLEWTCKSHGSRQTCAL